MKRIFSLLFTLALMQVAGASVRMRDVFASMPDSVLGLMTKNNRLDCIDFIENNMEAKVRNRLDGYSVLKAMTEDYLDLQLTGSCSVQMKLLPVTDSLSYICMVRTYSSPVQESVVGMYTQDWQPLPDDVTPEIPRYETFWEADGHVDMTEIERLQRLQDMRFVCASLSPEDLSLTFALQPGNVDKENAGRISAVLRPVTYVWRNGKFGNPD